MTVINTIKCDKCGLEILSPEKFLNAEAYGIDLHLGCVKQMSAIEIIRMLDLDDIKVMKINGWDESEKAPGYFRRGMTSAE
jgi:hypothetical protein